MMRKRKYNSDSMSSFTNKLKDADFSDIANCIDPETSFKLFFDKIDYLFNESFPLKNIKALNAKIRKDDPKSKHKSFKKKLSKRMRYGNRTYTSKLLKNKHSNSKNIWRYINEEVKGISPASDHITSINIDNITYTNSLDIANQLNQFFTNVGTKITDKIPHDQAAENDYIDNMQSKEFVFKFKEIQANDLLKINSTLKNKWSSGPDGIPSKIIKLVVKEKPHVICHLVNLSLTHVYIPERLKEALITPLHKKGDKEDCNNYRPISMLNSMSKILEKVVASQLRDFLESHDILHNMQFGFRAGHSTSHAMISTIRTLENAARKHLKSNCIFLDISKAFDTVSHKLLIKKLEKYGIRNHELKWFASYLQMRKQRCKIGDELSEFLHIETGIPQGSVLGPILFTILINDLPLYIKDLAISHLFVDDTKLCISAQSEKSLYEKTCKTLELAQHWFNMNRLSLNRSKTKLIRFEHEFEMNVKLDGESIQIVSSDNQDEESKAFRFLGFLIDEKLDLLTHKEKLIQKLDAALLLLRKIKDTLPTSQKLLIYKAIFQCHLDYGTICWTKHPELVHQISVLQNKAIGLVEGIYKKSHTEQLYKKLGILKFEDSILFNRAVFAHSIMYDYAPDRIKDCLDKVQPHTGVGRNVLDFMSDPTDRSSLFRRIIPNTWNNLSIKLRQQRKRTLFKKNLKASLLSTYKNTAYCRYYNCYLCK